MEGGDIAIFFVKDLGLALAGAEVIQNSQKFRVLWHGRTELTQVSGRYKNAVHIPSGVGGMGVQSLQKFRVHV